MKAKLDLVVNKESATLEAPEDDNLNEMLYASVRLAEAKGAVFAALRILFTSFIFAMLMRVNKTPIGANEMIIFLVANGICLSVVRFIAHRNFEKAKLEWERESGKRIRDETNDRSH